MALDEDCHVCGRPAVGEGTVEGVKVPLCDKCMSLGKKAEYYDFFKEEPQKARSKPRTFKPAGGRRTPAFLKPVRLVEGFGGVLKKARERRGLSRKQLGEKLFIRENELAAFEEERLKPVEEITKKLERFLEVEILVSGEEGEAAEAKEGGEEQKPAEKPTLGDVAGVR